MSKKLRKLNKKLKKIKSEIIKKNIQWNETGVMDSVTEYSELFMSKICHWEERTDKTTIL